MLTVDNIVTEFLADCPGLKADWDRHLEFWGNEERGTFNDMGVIAHYLVRCYEQQHFDDLAVAFALLERCFADGDEQAKEAATSGIIEDIQNISLNHKFDPHVFMRWLGPQTKKAWELMITAWQDVSSLADMVRKEAGDLPKLTPMPNLDEIEDPELRRMIEQMYRK
jgi:hypothetical protein